MTAGGRGCPNAELSSLEIYVHWPFCLSKCPYCDFNSHVADTVDHAQWRNALCADLAFDAERLTGRKVGSVFFGGGTPSLMRPETVAAVLEAVRFHWAVADDLEVTLEANPSSVDPDLMPAMRDAGVNRMSVGVQSFDDDVLRFLGRIHDADQARSAVETATRLFSHVSLDLIYAWPGQSAAHWAGEISEALARTGDHLSLYQLAIERGTDFHRQGLRPLDDDAAADLYMQAQETLEAASFPAYEISNHAHPDGACRHNTAIWRGGDYCGIGPGAHGRLTVGGIAHATRRTPAPDRWLELVESRGHGLAAREAIAGPERAVELLMTGLRLTDGIETARLKDLTGTGINDIVDAEALSILADDGLLEIGPSVLRVTATGRLRLDAILRSLLT